MKKRVLSALLALCMACTLAGNVWAAEETEPTPAPSAGVEAQTVEPQAVEPTPSADPTQAPAPSPDATAEPEATPEPSAAPDPTVEPDATPAPTEAPEATAAPAATATPDATAEPTATPAPTEVPAATATPEPSDAPEATAAPAVAYVAPVQTAEDQQINVHVDVPEGAFAENVAPTLHAQLITGETEEEQAELDKAAAQVAEQTGAAFDGMLALDVYFTDANAEDPEQEIEPALPVSVRLELSENVLPEGYDPATLAVHHLAEEKDAAGEPVTDENGEAAVTVETVANAVTDDAEVPGVVALSDAAAEAAEAPAEVARIADLPAPETAATPADEQAAAEAEQALTDPAVVAEFEVESFSYITITYNNVNRTIYFVDEDGNPLFGSGQLESSAQFKPSNFNNDENGKYQANIWVSIEALADTYGEFTDNYEFVNAYINRYGSYKQNVYWVRYKTDGNYYSNGWRYSTNVSRPNSNDGDEWNSDTGIYLVYRPITQVEQTGNLVIDDEIAQSGSIVAKYNDDSEVSYVWYKSETGEADTFVQVERLQITGDEWNISQDGTSLNVVLDGGAQCWYYVTAVNADGEVVATSNPFKVDYYDSLQNGSFENPDIDDLRYTQSNYQYPNETVGLVWKTTGDDNQIELGSVSYEDQWGYSHATTAGSDFNCGEAVDGTQFAELNANAAGALYQDVLTQPEVELNWKFSHRGRKGEDTMYLLIAPTEKVQGITTQNQLENLIGKIEENRSAYEEQGYFLLEKTTGQHWDGEEGTYTPVEGQYLTRFFFVAGQTAYDKTIQPGDERWRTIGNLLDDVWFSQELPDPNPGTGRLRVEKTISGLTYEAWNDLDSYTVTFSIANDENPVNFTKADFRRESDGSYTASKVFDYTVPANTKVEKSITESEGDIGGYTFTTAYSVNGEELKEGKTAKVGLRSGETTTVTFTNSYSAKEPLVPGHRKYIKANTDGTYDLTLDVTGSIDSHTEKARVDVLMIVDTSGSMGITNSNNEVIDDNRGNIVRARNAMKTLVTTLEAKQVDAKYSVVKFSGATQEHEGGSESDAEVIADWTAAGTKLTRVLDGIRAKGGTNYEAGLKKAKTQLDKAREDATTIVIFLSDGAPTWSIDHGYGSESLNIDGDGWKDTLNTAKTISCDKFYTVSIGSSFASYLNLYNFNGSYNTKGLAYNVNAETKDSLSVGTNYNVDDLTEVFTDIANKVTSVDCSNITITDTLSEYAKLTEQASFVVTIKRGENDSNPLTSSPISVEQAKTGYTGTLSYREDNEQKSISYSVKYDDSVKPNGQFKLSLASDYALENDWTYSITTQIEPTETAYNEYRENIAEEDNTGYDGVVGDADTDAKDNHTSSNQPGFRSNNSATLTYVSNGVDATENYAHPVIQVTKGDLEITKKVKGVQTTNEFSFTVTKLDEDDNKTNETYMVTVKAEETGTVTGLLPGNYLVEETRPDSIENYNYKGVTYKVGDDQPVNDAPTVEVTPGGVVEITATNTYEMETHSLTVKKNVTGGMGDTTKPFTFTVTGIENGEYDGTETKIVDGKEVETDIKVTVSNDKFTLKDGQSITFPALPVSGNYAVAEDEVAGYKQTASVTSGVGSANGRSYNTASLTENTVVTFENHREVVTPTGLESNHTKPYALMVGAGALAGLALLGGILARRARRRREW